LSPNARAVADFQAGEDALARQGVDALVVYGRSRTGAVVLGRAGLGFPKFLTSVGIKTKHIVRLFLADGLFLDLAAFGDFDSFVVDAISHREDSSLTNRP